MNIPRFRGVNNNYKNANGPGSIREPTERMEKLKLNCLVVTVCAMLKWYNYVVATNAKIEMQTVQRLHSTNSDQWRDNRLDGMGFTHAFITNRMSHLASAS